MKIIFDPADGIWSVKKVPLLFFFLKQRKHFPFSVYKLICDQVGKRFWQSKCRLGQGQYGS